MNHLNTHHRRAGTGLTPVLYTAAACLLLGVSALSAAQEDWDDDVQLYIGDVGDDTVKMFDGKTGDFLGDLVTSGSGGLSGPMGMIFKGGKLLLANQNFGFDNGEVLRYQWRTGDFVDALVASDDPNAPYAPRGIVRSPSGNQLYVADVGTQGYDCANEGRVARYRLSNGTYLGDFDRDGFDAPFYPRGLVLGPDGLLYVSAFGCPYSGNPLGLLIGFVLRFDPRTGMFVDVFASNETIPELHRPEGLVFDEDGNLWVTSFRADADDNDKILELSGPDNPNPGELKRVLPLADPVNEGGVRAYAQAILFGPDGDLFIPISGGDATTAGEVRRCETSDLSCETLIPADGTLIAPYYLTFGRTDPSTLDYRD
jgi:sugar lactone lactonase YvrE